MDDGASANGSEHGEGEWVRVAFQEAEADIRWAKERATAVTYWSVLLIFGVAALPEISRGVPTALHSIAVIGLWVIGALWLVGLSHFAAQARDHVDRLLGHFPVAVRYPATRGRDRNHRLHLISQLLVMAGAGFFAWFELLRW